MAARRHTIGPVDSGFHGCAAPVGSRRLVRAVAVSLALGALSLCLAVTLALVAAPLALALPG